MDYISRIYTYTPLPLHAYLQKKPYPCHTTVSSTTVYAKKSTSSSNIYTKTIQEKYPRIDTHLQYVPM